MKVEKQNMLKIILKAAGVTQVESTCLASVKL
jgi:hypothetical protein